MIFKAVVVSRINEDNQVYITIPALDGSTSKSDFRGVTKRLANICTLPGCTPVYATGDIVYVDFEQDNMAEPVVLGLLLSSKSKSSIINLDAESLTVNVNTKLSNDFIVGETSYYDIIDNSQQISGGSEVGFIDVSKGGTGLTTVTSGNYLVGNGTSPFNEKTPAQVRADIGAIDSQTLDDRLGRSDAVDHENTNYTTLMARGSKLLSTQQYTDANWATELENGSIAWKYE